MEFINLKKQYSKIESEINTSINGVLAHGKYIMGPEVNSLENQLTQYVDSKYCISCSSGTDALLMSLLAINIKPGDAIITTPFTFIATAEVISLIGATPIFVDINPYTFNIDTDLIGKKIEEVQANTNLNVKAIIPVNIFGLPCDYNMLYDISNKYNIEIIEDAAQSFGAQYYNKRSCSLSNLSCTSFFPAKPLGCYGDGGAIFTNDHDLYEKLISIRVHGKGKHKYDNVNIGINGRLDTIQAAILIEKLKIFDDEINSRQVIAEKYRNYLKDDFVLQDVPENHKSAWAQFSLLADDEQSRDKIMNYLRVNDIPTAIYYPKPLHKQTAFQNINNINSNESFSVTEEISNKIFSIPMHPYLSDNEINKICNTLIKAKNEL
tara:strand:- start:711 stop:1847 length:1137 start_codon:yes stop_codon:yes gene_type:complete